MFRFLIQVVKVIFNILSILPVILIWPFTYLLSKKISNKEWEELKDLECYHITKSANIEGISKGENVYLKRTSDLFKNLFCPEKAVYFFIGTPNSIQYNINLAIEKFDKKVIVSIHDMMQDRIRIRRYDKALMYMSDYEGPGRIEEFSKSELKRTS